MVVMVCVCVCVCVCIRVYDLSVCLSLHPPVPLPSRWTWPSQEHQLWLPRGVAARVPDPCQQSRKKPCPLKGSSSDPLWLLCGSAPLPPQHNEQPLPTPKEWSHLCMRHPQQCPKGVNTALQSTDNTVVNRTNVACVCTYVCTYSVHTYVCLYTYSTVCAYEYVPESSKSYGSMQACIMCQLRMYNTFASISAASWKPT